MSRPLPPSASVASTLVGAKLHAPAAARNAAALCDLLRAHAPKKGIALEIASGTGQHVTTFAKALPGLVWQPTEVDPARRRSIDAYVSEAGLSNVSPAVDLNATQVGWSGLDGPFELIFLANLLHLVSRQEAQVLIGEAATALAPGGTLMLYGPFRREGELTSAGDATFDAELRTADPSIGYKDTVDITAWLDDAGLIGADIVPMPANNLAFIARKPTS